MLTQIATFLAVTKDEVVKSGASPENAVRLADYKGNFVGGLGVYHHLHCLVNSPISSANLSTSHNSVAPAAVLGIPRPLLYESNGAESGAPNTPSRYVEISH